MITVNSPRLLLALSLTLVSASCSALPPNSGKEGKIYVFESDESGFNTKNFFYDNGEEVVVFDSQFTPDIAKKSLAFLRTKTQNPISYLILTHPNPDKFNGAKVFQDEGAKVIASRSTAENMPEVHEYKKYYFVQVAKMFTEQSYPTLPTVDLTFESSYKLTLGNGERIELSELGTPGVSTNQTIAFIPNQESLMVGDLIHHNAHAWLEGGIVSGAAKPTLKEWIAALELLASKHEDSHITVFGGRGEPVSLRKAAKAQIHYLREAQNIVRLYVQNLGESAKSELQSDQAGKHYTAIQTKMEQAFPEYKLGYMIQYGIYGLVNSML